MFGLERAGLAAYRAATCRAAYGAMKLAQALGGTVLADKDPLPPSEFARLLALTKHLDAEHERIAPDPHWYLNILGVEPLSRGRGIGRELLRPVLKRADAAGQPCYLETQSEQNVGVYEKVGFRVASEGEVPGRRLRVWTMRREPEQPAD